MSKSATLLLAIFSITFCFSQTDLNKDLKIFLDCNICDNTYIKQNLGNVEFVRDQGLSDVHLFFVT